MIKLRYFQEICIKKLAYKNKVLIAAKCRFGKTITALELTKRDSCKKILIISGMRTLEGGWNEAIEATDVDATFETFQALKNKSFEELANGYDCVIIDEAHYYEQTVQTKELLSKLKKVNNINFEIYLTATPYTGSLIDSFGKENTYKFSYQEEMEAFDDYLKGLKKEYAFDYTPVKMTICSPNIDYVGTNENGVECWSKVSIEKLFEDFDRKGISTFLYFVPSTKHASKIIKAFREFDIDICTLTGEDKKDYEDIEAVQEKCLEAKAENRRLMIIACKRGGTGVTWKGLDAVLFYNAPNSAIDFVQKASRCMTPEEGKKEAYIYCINKETVLSIIYKFNYIEASYRGKDPKENFEKFKKCVNFEIDDFDKTIDYSVLEVAIGKKLSYLTFDFGDVKIETTAHKSSTKNTKDDSKKKKDSPEKNPKDEEKPNDEDSKDSTSSEKTDKQLQDEEAARRTFYDNFIETYKILIGAFKCTDEELLDDKTYDENEWIEDIYLAPLYISREDFKDLIRRNGNALRVSVEEKIEKVSINKPTPEEIYENYGGVTEALKTKESWERVAQGELKKLSFKFNGIFFGKNLTDDKEYAHILDFAKVKNIPEIAFDFENGIILPIDLHRCIDRGDIKIKLLKDGRIQLVKVNKDLDAHWHFETVSEQPLSEGQIKYLKMSDKIIK